LVSALGGCAYVAPASVPIEQRWEPGPLTPPRHLMVFLPGIGDSADEFVEHGFVRLLQARHPERVRKRPGIHDWNAWTPLYQELLEQLTVSETETP
jgi:hypothetical protein